MTCWEWDPDTYLAEMAAELPGYAELQDAVAAATGGIEARTVLELGTGTGETALRVLALNPTAAWMGIDSSEAMLARVDPHPGGGGIEGKHTQRRLAGAGAQLENRSSLDPAGRGGDGILQLRVARELGGHLGEVGV